MKIIDIQVLSRGKALEFKSDSPWAAISVSTHAADLPVLDTRNRLGLLQLAFWDIGAPASFPADKPHILLAMKEKLFKQEQAQQILVFAKEVVPRVETLVVHCEAGISRSPAIAAAISYVLWGPETSNVYFKRFLPNSFVYKTIIETHFGKDSPEMSYAFEQCAEKAQEIREKISFGDDKK